MTNEANDLPTCPFCNGPAALVVGNADGSGALAELADYGDEGVAAEAGCFCHDCGAQGPTYELTLFDRHDYRRAIMVARRAWGARAAPVTPDQAASLADRMRAAGMLTIDEMLSGAPLDGFIRHAGVCDLETYKQWLDMKCREFLSMQAARELEKREDDDLYEWVLAHAAAFQEARINLRAAMRGSRDA